MSETLLAKLDSSRKELLDLGLRNPLLNYKGSKVRGVKIIQEKSTSIFDLLVRNSKSMSFLSKTQKEEGPESLFEDEETEEQIEESYNDLRLQTNETDKVLQSRLLNTYYAANTSIEEQGYNILFIALGFLNWFDVDHSEDTRKAPLILIPVTLERSSAKEKFKVKYSSEEIGSNISLKAKLKTDFYIEIPDLPESEDLDVIKYFKSIEKAISNQTKWSVDYYAIELGFFSFGKFMIYNDLDNNKWPKEKNLITNSFLKQLFETGFSDPPIIADELTHIDKETNAHELYQVVDADSSQILTMLAISEGRNLVIQGPPGTGKSQTITNIIAHAIGNGKKVLFVAEKMAALEVVKRRLDTIGIGDACLELHSHKSNKKDLLAEIKRVFDLGKPKVEHLESQVYLLNDLKKELNNYSDAINTKVGKINYSVNQLIGFLSQIKSTTNGIKIPNLEIENIENWRQEDFNKALNFIERIQVRLNEIGDPTKNIFYGSRLTILLPQEQDKILEKINTLSETLRRLITLCNEIASIINIESVKNISEVESLFKTCQLIERKPNLQGFKINDDNWLKKAKEIQELIESGKIFNEINERFKNDFIEEVWEINAIDVRLNLITHGKKWYRFLIKDYNRTIRYLKSFSKNKLPNDYHSRLQILEDIIQRKQVQEKANGLSISLSDLFNRHWDGLRTKWDKIEEVNNYLYKLHLQISISAIPSSALNYLNNEHSVKNALNYNEVQQALDDFINLENQLKETLLYRIDFETNYFKNNSDKQFSEKTRILDLWIINFNEIHKIISWNLLEEQANEQGYSKFIQVAKNWELSASYLSDAFRKNFYEQLVGIAFSKNQALRNFEKSTHENVAKQFRTLDQVNFHLKRAQVALSHWQTIPKDNAGGQVNILKTEFNKRARHFPIRKLIKEAGFALQAIKPVFMMSPMSIANFLAPGELEFDLVIFDEASQVRPVDAIGAIIRGKQLVVVGDTKQMPPTDFFNKLIADDIDEDEEENVTSDMQSILGMCSAKGIKERMLRWHYRSKHESLISVSNHEFYDDKLVVFPSPGSNEKHGLILNHFTNTWYDRGKTRTNPKEAEIVAERVILHAKNCPELTLGVVAFSSAQRLAIQNALEIKRREQPESEEFFRNHPHEPFFIKNLENVQGDERDVIFISIGYGKNQEGYFSMSFGPSLGNEGGEKRLNVLITRAKLKCEVFTNITADDIDITKTKNKGIPALKSFLYYAQHGKLNLITETNKDADSPFEESVAQALRLQGYDVRKQVGSIGFFIDLAIVDQEYPGKYIIGIECDGASYHSSRSARDRDRLRQQVLEANGWILYRVWSTDWFRNSDEELKKLILAIENAKAKTIKTEKQEIQTPVHQVSREEKKEIEQESNEYVFAKLPHAYDFQQVYDLPSGKLSGMIQKVVAVESPVHIDEVARRITEAAGFVKVGSRIRTAIDIAIRLGVSEKAYYKKGDFLYSPGQTNFIIRSRYDFPSSLKKIQFISPDEIGLAIISVINDSIAIDVDSCLKLSARTLGFRSVSEDIKATILKVLKSLQNEGKIKQENDLLRIINA